MQGPKALLEHQNHWKTDVGAWFPGERVVFRGKDLFHELQDMSWMELLLYGITGRIPDETQIRLFNGIWALSTSYPELRLWNNRIAALAGTARSTASLGVSAGTAISEALIYGRRPDIRCIDFLHRTQKKLDAGHKLDELVTQELKKYRSVPGYGRPVVRTDERIQPIMRLAKELGLDNKPYISLAFEVEKTLLAGRWRLHINIASVLAALAADQGFSPHEYYHSVVLSFSAGMFPCYQDAAHKKEGTLFPFPCSAIEYGGTNKRSWIGAPGSRGEKDLPQKLS